MPPIKKRSPKISSRYYLPRRRYVGTIGTNETKYEIKFSAYAETNLRLKISTIKIEPNAYFYLRKNFGTVGKHEDWLSISAVSKDGTALSSDRISIRSIGSDKHGFYINIEALGATVKLIRRGTSNQTAIRMWLRSFRCIPQHVLETRLGNLVVHGASTIKSLDEVSGYAAVYTEKTVETSDWYDRADEFLDYMHQGLSFAHGGRLQIPAVEYASKEFIKIDFYSGEGMQSELANQHFMNYYPIIEALNQNYISNGPLPNIVWSALNWTQIPTNFDEIRFLSAMTAIESLADNQLPYKSKSFINKHSFSKLKSALISAVQDQEEISEEEKIILTKRVSEINQKSLSHKILSLLHHYDIYTEDFNNESIRSLIKIRNEIVHKGKHSDKNDIWSGIILCRELIWRVIMRKINFSGYYRCYIGGEHQREFV